MRKRNCNSHHGERKPDRSISPMACRGLLARTPRSQGPPARRACPLRPWRRPLPLTSSAWTVDGPRRRRHLTRHAPPLRTLTPPVFHRYRHRFHITAVCLRRTATRRQLTPWRVHAGRAHAAYRLNQTARAAPRAHGEAGHARPSMQHDPPTHPSSRGIRVCLARTKFSPPRSLLNFTVTIAVAYTEYGALARCSPQF